MPIAAARAGRSPPAAEPFVAGRGQHSATRQVDARPGNPHGEHKRQARPPPPLLAQVPDELEAAVGRRHPPVADQQHRVGRRVVQRGPDRQRHVRAPRRTAPSAGSAPARRWSASLRPRPACGSARPARGRRASRSAPGRRRRCRRRRRSCSPAGGSTRSTGSSPRPAGRRPGRRPAGWAGRDDLHPRGQFGQRDHQRPRVQVRHRADADLAARCRTRAFRIMSAPSSRCSSLYECRRLTAAELPVSPHCITGGAICRRHSQASLPTTSATSSAGKSRLAGRFCHPPVGKARVESMPTHRAKSSCKRPLDRTAQRNEPSLAAALDRISRLPPGADGGTACRPTASPPVPRAEPSCRSSRARSATPA